MEAMRWGLPLLGSWVVLAACGDMQTGTGRWDGSVRDSAGVRIVENGAVGLWGEDRPAVVQELSLGRMDGDGPDALGSVVAVDVDADGRMFVLDGFAQEVRVFDADGRHIRSLGGPGTGPGELSRNVVGVFVAPDGTVRVPDLGNARVTSYTREGASAGSWPIRIQEGVPIRWDAAADGTLMAQLRAVSAFSSEAAPTGSTPGDPVVRYAQDGSVADTLALLPVGGSVTAGAGGAPAIRLFEAEPVWDAGPDGTVAWGMSTEYDIALQAAMGAPHQRIRRAAVRRPVTEGDEAALRRMMRRLMIDQGAPPNLVDGILQGMSVASSYPVMAAVELSPEGEVWVQRVRVPADMSNREADFFDPQDLGSHEWDVFDSEGRYLGVLAFPQRFTLLAVVGDRVYGVVRDELDVQRLLRLRIERM